ncbi:MAG: UDP-N-acetylmuramoyl-L-alanyl-D-glutamate--2,6-diaminopimelate ligase [Polynucleobacter sp.]
MMVTLIKPEQAIDHLRQLALPAAHIVSDTRQIKAGDIFLAYKVGHGAATQDGRPYIADALDAGAAAVIYDPTDLEGSSALNDSRCLALENLSAHAGSICSDWYGNPSGQMMVFGVTGTNGKTSITQWLSHALDRPKSRAAVIGTLGIGYPGQLEATGYTTPNAARLQTELKALLDSNAKQIAMEVSSHALEQGRVNGVQFATAVFSNLSQDHLDYHGSMAEYAAVKFRLFQFPGLQNAVINLEDPLGRELAMQLLAKTGVQVWGYAVDRNAFIGFEKFGKRLHAIFSSGMRFKDYGYQGVFEWQDHGRTEVSVPVVGDFNLSNCLAVWSCLLASSMDVLEASKRIALLKPVSGRMEMVLCNSRSSSPLVIVDYAHTPDALEKVLNTLRPIATQRAGKLWCIFGCGGDRDTSKRPLMGRIAAELADHIILTSDNPRSENPEKISADIQAGISNGKSVEVILDRAAAILSGVRHAEANDVVLIAGKGHETSQEINGRKVDFSDQEHVLLASGGFV